MPSAVRRVPAALLALAFAVVAVAQDGPKKDPPKAETTAGAKAADPTPADVAALADKFKAERADAAAAQYPADALARADDLARRAESALRQNNPRAAARYYRDARWQVPYRPAGLPPHVSRVFGESRMRHAEAGGAGTARVNAVAYGPANTLASASRDGTVRLWDLETGREVLAYRGHLNQPDDPTRTTATNTNVLGVVGVAFHPREGWAASAAGNQVHLWAVDSGERVKVLLKVDKLDQPLKCLAFSPDGTRLAVGGDDGVLRVVAVPDGKVTYVSPARGAHVERVAFSRDGRLVAVADYAGKVGVYAPNTPNPVVMGVDAGVGGECLGVAFAPDGGVFVGGRSGTARLLAGPRPDGTAAPNTAAGLRAFDGHNGLLTDLAVSPDGTTLVTAGEDKTVRVWEVATGKQLRSLQGHFRKPVAVAVRPDGRQAASGGEDGSVRLWDLAADDDHRVVSDAGGPVWAAAVSPDGKRAAAAGADKLIRVYDPETGKLETTLTGHTAAVTALAFFPDGNRLLSAGGDRRAIVWDVAAKKVRHELTGHELPVLAAAVSPDGKRVVTGGADRTARGWDADTGKPLWSWTGPSAVCAVAVRVGGQVAAGTADGTLAVLDVAAGGSPKEVSTQTPHAAGVAAVAYSPDGLRLATAGGDGAVRVWAVGEGGRPAPLVKFDGQPKANTPAGFSPLAAVAFSPDGRLVAAGGADGVVRLWDVQTRAEVRGLRGNADWATAVAFGPDARLVVTAGADKSVRVYELLPQEGGATAGHLRATNGAAVSLDGKTVATASADQTVRLWDLASGKETAALVGPTDELFAVAFLGADRLAVGGTVEAQRSGQVHVWGLAPSRLLASVATGRVYALAALPDGSKVAAFSARAVPGQDAEETWYELFDRDGKVLATVPDKGRKVLAATFSADLSRVAAGDDGGAVRFWDLLKKERIGADWQVFDGPVGDLGLTPDGKTLVALDAAGGLKVADVGKREVVASATAHPGGARGLVVSPKGDGFVTYGADREVKAWPLAAAGGELKEARSWPLPVGVNGVAYTPDGKKLVTANADGTAYVLDLP